MSCIVAFLVVVEFGVDIVSASWVIYLEGISMNEVDSAPSTGVTT